VTTTATRPGVGELLRGWRERRRLSQLDLALQAEVSTRHLSFIETGRASPSREMLLHLADQLDVPLRERNALLLAAGYAPVYVEAGLDSPQLAAVRAALRQILTAHEPNPAVVLDRHWNVVDANTGLGIFLSGVDSTALVQPPVNVLRLSLHPQGVASRIVNLGQWRAHLLSRLRRQVARTNDPQLINLQAEVQTYPCTVHTPEIDIPGPGEVVVPLRFRHQQADHDLSFISTMAVFGAPLDITVEELAIELFFPADAATAAFLQDRSPQAGTLSRNP
jgi:transcriptional regulator with XRE-family HTH domain